MKYLGGANYFPWIQEELIKENLGYVPENHPIGSEADIQFSYYPRTKVSQEYAKKFFKDIKRNSKKQSKKVKSQKSKKD